MWGEDEAGPFQTLPYSGQQWGPAGHPARYPHEHVRNGTAKLLTLYHPASGAVRVQGVTSCRNPVLHGWLKAELRAIPMTLPTLSGAGQRCGKPGVLGAVARGAVAAHHLECRITAVAPAVGAGQSDQPQDAKRRVLAVGSRHYAAVYAAGWFLAEHDRERAAHPLATGAGRATPDSTGRDHHRA